MPVFPRSVPLRRLARGALGGARHAIDHVDDAVVALAGLRRHLVRAAAHGKQIAGLPRRDAPRGAQVLAPARRVAGHVPVPRDAPDALMRTLISDACRQQAQTSFPSRTRPMIVDTLSPTLPRRMLRLLPPPRRWRPLLARLPARLQAPLVERLLGRSLAGIDAGALALIEDRRLGIDIDDLGLHWVLVWNAGRLRVCDAPAEATVRGSATDLALLASRLEDADTLFFQRRLVLTGDVELGLTVRNLLDRMPWEDLPLAQRIVLQRGARVLRAAREAGSH